MSLRFFAILFLLIGLTTACGDEPVDMTNELIGRWEIIHAFRDQMPTESLTGLYYDFGEGGQLRTNMTGAEEQYVYSLDNLQLQQREGMLDADYNIEKLTADTLILRTELRRKQFRMILQKTQVNGDSISTPALGAETE